MYKSIQNTMIDHMSSYIHNFTIEALETSMEISPKCKESIEKSFNKENNVFKYKFIRDSSKVMNDVSSYKDCYYKYYNATDEEIFLIKHNITFVVFVIHKVNISNFPPSTKSIFGLCVPRGCTSVEYLIIFRNMSSLEFFEGSSIGITPFDMNEKRNEEKSIILYLIPAFMVFGIGCLSIFRNIIFPMPQTRKGNIELRKYLVSTNHTSISAKPKMKINFIMQIILIIRECFDLNDNCEELTRSQITIYDRILYNDSGLSIINGIRAIAMILIVIGVMFETLSLSPTMSSEKHLMNLFKIPSMSFILWCQRFGKKLSFCVSGTILMYKMLNYLDAEIENLESKDTNQTINSHISQAYKHYHNKIGWMSLVYFLYKNIYKYVLFWFFAINFKYSFWEIIAIVVELGPQWISFKKHTIDTFSLKTMFGIEYLQSTHLKASYFKVNPFSLAINEVHYFLIGILLIFICYKHNIRMDIILLIGCFICLIGKLFIYNYWFENEKSIEKMFPAKNFLFSINSYFLKSVPYNVIYFFYGLYIGLINYSLQKADLVNEEKAFTTMAFTLIKFFQKNKGKYILPFALIIIVFLMFSYYLLFHWFYGNNTQEIQFFLENYWINMFYLYDNEMMLASLMFCILQLLLYSDNAIIGTLKDFDIKSFTRPYWIFTFSIYATAYYIIYQNDMNFNLDINSLMFFSIIAVILVSIIDSMLFIFLDVPMKKITKYAINFLRKSNEDERSTDYSDPK